MFLYANTLRISDFMDSKKTILLIFILMNGFQFFRLSWQLASVTFWMRIDPVMGKIWNQSISNRDLKYFSRFVILISNPKQFCWFWFQITIWWILWFVGLLRCLIHARLFKYLKLLLSGKCWISFANRYGRLFVKFSLAICCASL